MLLGRPAHGGDLSNQVTDVKIFPNEAGKNVTVKCSILEIETLSYLKLVLIIGGARRQNFMVAGSARTLVTGSGDAHSYSSTSANQRSIGVGIFKSLKRWGASKIDIARRQDSVRTSYVQACPKRVLECFSRCGDLHGSVADAAMETVRLRVQKNPAALAGLVLGRR